MAQCIPLGQHIRHHQIVHQVRIPTLVALLNTPNTHSTHRTNHIRLTDMIDHTVVLSSRFLMAVLGYILCIRFSHHQQPQAKATLLLPHKDHIIRHMHSRPDIQELLSGWPLEMFRQKIKFTLQHTETLQISPLPHLVPLLPTLRSRRDRRQSFTCCAMPKYVYLKMTN